MIKFNYYQQRRRQMWQRFAFAFFFVVIFYLIGGFVLRPLVAPLSLTLRPLWWGSEALSSVIFSIVDFSRSQNKLAIENRRLLAENNDLRTKLLARDEVLLDNKFLRQNCGRLDEGNNPLLGEVIFLPNFIPYQTILVDIGSKNSTQALAVGDLAVSLGDVLIGRVVELGPWSSKIKLLSAEKELPVTVGSSKIPALATGAGAGNFSIILPKGTPIKAGEAVRAPLYNNLLIGVVRYVEKAPSSPNQTVLVKTPANLWQLQWLKFYDVKI